MFKCLVIIILYLKIVQNNDTMKLALFSTVENNTLTNKNVIQLVKRTKWTKKLKLSQGLIQKLSQGLHSNYKCVIFKAKD